LVNIPDKHINWYNCGQIRHTFIHYHVVLLLSLKESLVPNEKGEGHVSGH